MKSTVFACVTGLVLLFCVAATARPAHADIVFDLSNASAALSDGLSNGDTVTAGGITMTFSNVLIADGSSAGEVESSGILMSATTDNFNDVLQFDFSFSSDVIITQYTIGQYEDIDANRFFGISGPNGTSGDNMLPEGTSGSSEIFAFDSGTISMFQAGQVYTFTHNLTNTQDSTFNLRSFSVASVPEPGTASLAFAGLAGLLWRRQRCR